VLAAVMVGGGVGPASAASLIPPTHVRNGVCGVTGTTPSTVGTAAPSVSSRPTGVSVVWLPGLNDKSCKAVLVKGRSGIATALARDIDIARIIPHAGTYSCPVDDGTAARLYFTYGRHRAVQRVDADLSGCAWITAPGRGARASSSRFRRDMTTLAPSAWRPYISPTPDPSG
jgi:hypothetical protein